MAAVLADFGFADLGLTASDFLESETIVQLGYPPNRIDLVTSISGGAFAQAWERRVAEDVEGVVMPFLGREDLLANMAASGRPKDLADLDAPS